MSNLTPKLEEAFERIKDMLRAVNAGEDIGALAVLDAVLDLEGDVEQVLSNTCYLCGEPLPPLCRSCEEWENEKAAHYHDELATYHLVSVGRG